MSGALHVVSLPHTQTDGTYWTCAYTGKIERFCRMMTGHGRDVILYGGEFNTAPCDEYVTVVTEKQRRGWFGDHDENDPARGGFNGQQAWEPTQMWWTEMNARAIGQIRKRCDERDILCLIMGRSQQLIADAIPFLTTAEFGVGYEGIIIERKGGPCFAAFESQAHMHFVYGLNGWRYPRWYDAVIPNYYDPDDFPWLSGGGGAYLLFVGRLIPEKGVDWLGRIATALDMPLVVAGHGDAKIDAPDVTYLGAIGPEQRAKVMSEAACLLAPTGYVGPFEGVAVEAMLCGTPVVSTDWGAFTETVQIGVSGYRFRTLAGAVDAVRAALELPHGPIREWAERYTLDSVRPLYDEWLERLDGLWGEGLYALPAVEVVG